MVWSVCIFAHNEERLLPRCLGACDRAAAGGDYVVHIIENGSRDGTARVARALAAADPRVRVHELALADKSNAWNHYVHKIAGAAEMHVFIDGDVRPAAGAFEALARAFSEAPSLYAAAALPASGRSRRRWATRLYMKNYLSGNLYALRGETIGLLRDRNIRLPVGAVGEDGVISYLMLTDLAGGRDDSHSERIAAADGAFFEFDSLQPNMRDLKIFHRRMRRYSRRRYQAEILYDILKEGGVAAMPDLIDEIYTRESLARLRPRLNPLHFFVDRKMLKRLRAEAAERVGCLVPSRDDDSSCAAASADKSPPLKREG
jgi:glycosyltransferase involved in cell wall biosynthesis